MRVIEGAFGPEIRLDADEVRKLCRPGEGADTCIWAMVDSQGLCCGYYNRHPTLVERWKAGSTVAKRDGCDVVKALKLNQKVGP